MNCTTFQERLEALLDDTLSAAERRAVERHAAGCPRCRELVGLMRGDLGLAPVAPPEDLAASILAQTSGSACGRARDLLCDLTDGALDGLDAALVSRHTAHCAPCRQTEVALRRLAHDLPAMAELTPDAAFVGDVLAATAPRRQHRDRRGAWGRRLAAWADAWSRLLARPRFGLEAGYVGGLAVWVLFGLSASPFGHIPGQALEVLQRGPTAGIERAESAVTTLQSQLGDLSRQTLEASGERGAQVLDAWSSDVGRRLQRTSASRGKLLRHGEELGDAALQLDLETTTRAARDLGAGLGELWRDLSPAGSDTRDADPPTPNNDSP